ncbi:hypothetical protein Tco_0822432 [Tanacetum coccineum]|uniref:Uncharacterized protein n=1 Tax=Tanacetum coccineum TaxID=301880 RepID=A0ABQ5AJC2_9ASTR
MIGTKRYLTWEEGLIISANVFAFQLLDPKDLIREILCVAMVPESVKEFKNLKKSPKEIIKPKKEQGEMKAHDSDDDEDDDDDESPSAGSNQGRSTKRRRSDSAASGSAKPPPKDDNQSSKKPRESEASVSKQHPALTSIGWQRSLTLERLVMNRKEEALPKLIDSSQKSGSQIEMLNSQCDQCQEKLNICQEDKTSLTQQLNMDKTTVIRRSWEVVGGMTRDRSKTSSLQSRKSYRSEGSIQSLDSFVGERIEILTTGSDQSEQRDDILVTIKRCPKLRKLCVMYFIHKCTDGVLTVDVRCVLGDDIKKAQDHSLDRLKMNQRSLPQMYKIFKCPRAKD